MKMMTVTIESNQCQQQKNLSTAINRMTISITDPSSSSSSGGGNVIKYVNTLAVVEENRRSSPDVRLTPRDSLPRNEPLVNNFTVRECADEGDGKMMTSSIQIGGSNNQQNGFCKKEVESHFGDVNAIENAPLPELDDGDGDDDDDQEREIPYNRLSEPHLTSTKTHCHHQSK